MPDDVVSRVLLKSLRIKTWWIKLLISWRNSHKLAMKACHGVQCLPCWQRRLVCWAWMVSVQILTFCVALVTWLVCHDDSELVMILTCKGLICAPPQGVSTDLYDSRVC